MSEPADRYKAFDLEARDLGDGKRFLWNRRSGEREITDAETVSLLFSLEEFRSIDEHARRRAQTNRSRLMEQGGGSFGQKMFARVLRLARDYDLDLPLQENEIGPVRERLRSFVEEGWLTSEQELLDEVIAICQEQTREEEVSPITSVGIPTRNRPDCLKRALTSYIANFKKYGRSPRILVADNSEDEDAQAQNRGALEEIGQDYPGETRYLGLEERAQMAARIAEKSGVDEKIVRFGLLGDPKCSGIYGAARNTILLATKGENIMQLDDDTICNIGTPPETESGLSLNSSLPIELWWYGSEEEAFDAVSYEDHDILGLHEQMLGRRAKNVIIEHGDLNISDLSSSLLKTLRHDNPTVAFSMLGTAGDSGMHRNHNMTRLLLEGPSWNRLVESKEKYRERLNSRNIIRASPRPTLFDHIFCMSMSIGLDNRGLVPPYIPVQRDEDGVFRALLKSCSPSKLGAHLPHVVQHSPQSERTHEYIITSSDFAKPTFRINDIVKPIILNMRSLQETCSPDTALQAVGSQFINIAQLDPDALRNYITSVATQSLSNRIKAVHRRASTKSIGTESWRDDLERLLLVHLDALSEPLPELGMGPSTQRNLQRAAGSYGNLLTLWNHL